MRTTKKQITLSMPTRIGVCCVAFFAFTIWQLDLNEKSHTRDHEFREAILSFDDAGVHRLLAQGVDATHILVGYNEPNFLERLIGIVKKSEQEEPPLDFLIATTSGEVTKRRTLLQLASRQLSNGVKNRGVNSEMPSEKSYFTSQQRRLAIMNDLFDHNCKFNPSPPSAYSLLQNSSMAGGSEVIQFLLAHGAKIDANDPGAAIALNWACQSGDLETVKTLLDNGAKVNSSHSQGLTALMQTAIMGVHYPKDAKYTAILRFLIERGADVDQKDSYHRTALMMAERSPQLVLTPEVKEIISSLKKASRFRR